IADQLSDSPFGQVHRLSALAFSILKFYNFGRSNTATRNYSATRRLLLSLVKLIFSFRAWHTRTLGEVMAIRRLAKGTRRSLGFHFFALSARFVPLCKLVSMLCSSIQIPRNQGFYISYWHTTSI
ncbi:hypothetical protein MTR67_035273, partial [Solanum verrucosum]